jgi:receptor-interacting serine/threonine-protein kinase 4
MDRKVVKLLLEHYLDSPVHLAARTDDIEALKRTLSEPYVPGLSGRYGQTPLLDAALHGREAALQYLLDKGESACDRDYRGWSAVHMAASTGQVAVLEKLLKKTNDVPDVNGVDYWGRTPLHVAAEHRQLNAVKLLLGFKAHVDAETFFDCTALHYACERNHPDMIKVLLDRGAAVNAFERRTGSNALHLCADHGALEAAEVLLSQGIALDTKDLHWGDTAFMRACQNGHRTICELLLNRGAKTDVTGLDQRTPLHWAAEFGHIDVLNFLLEHGGRNAKRELYNGFTPLHLAVQSGVNEVVEMLLQSISIDELESKDLSYMTPLALARNRNDAHMIQILEKARATLDTGASSDLETSGTL